MIFINKFYKKCGLETSTRFFFIITESTVKRSLRSLLVDFDMFWQFFLLRIQLSLKTSFSDSSGT